MSRELAGAAILAAGTWAILTSAVMAPAPMPRGHVWVVKSSDMIRSHPELVRAAPPSAVVASPRIGGGEGKVPEG
jgi:hypothetical protein